MMLQAGSSGNRLLDVDFSLAIHNRTGKYFIGRDLLADAQLPLGDTWFWGLRADAPPGGLLGRVVGRLQHWHIHGHALGGGWRLLPQRRNRRPLLHLDPFTVPSTRLSPADAVLIHDLGPVTHPKLFPAEVSRIYEAVYRDIAAVGPHLIFVSEATRAIFHRRFPDSVPSSSRVIYPPIRTDLSAGPEEPVGVPAERFLLCVGSVGERKNQLRCIQAYTRSGLHDRGVALVLCGGREPGYEDVATLAPQVPGVLLLSYVTDAQLSWLYGHALGFVLVSLLEGFGMPVAEAIARGLVPLVSADSVLEEVAGEGALLADPESVGAIADGMVTLAELDAGERERRLVLLRESVDRFRPPIIAEHWRRAVADILR